MCTILRFCLEVNIHVPMCVEFEMSKSTCVKFQFMSLSIGVCAWWISNCGEFCLLRLFFLQFKSASILHSYSFCVMWGCCERLLVMRKLENAIALRFACDANIHPWMGIWVHAFVEMLSKQFLVFADSVAQWSAHFRTEQSESRSVTRVCHATTKVPAPLIRAFLWKVISNLCECVFFLSCSLYVAIFNAINCCRAKETNSQRGTNCCAR